ncbi:MAG: hypothetical protein KAH16_03005 [Candidatus Izimaplasma sp.]|nr:hypothetical protein [Candidatus Izimaplasma bacterium]
MKNTSKIYLFLTSLFFMFAPFSLGLVEIYFENSEIGDQYYGLMFNIALIIILPVTIGILLKNKKLQLPNRMEIKFLVFGLLSNIVIFFYTFQNALHIENFVTIYFTIILVLLLYMLMIDQKKINYELWILAVLFFIVDFIHYQYIGDHSEYFVLARQVEANFIQRVFYFTIPISTLTLFITKIKKYKIIDTFAYIFIAITILILLIFFKGINPEDKFILTLNLLIPFVIIIDFIVEIIYKRFNVYKLTFYIRMGTIIILIFIYNGINYFSMDSYSNHDFEEMVMIIYVVLVCNIIEFLVPKKSIV